MKISFLRLVPTLVVLVAYLHASTSYPLAGTGREADRSGLVMRRALLNEKEADGDDQSELIVPLLGYIGAGINYIPALGPAVTRFLGSPLPNNSTVSFGVEFPEEEVIKLIDSF